MSKFDSIAVGRYFKAAGASYKKTAPGIYVSLESPDIEIYWDPMFDARIEGVGAPSDGKPVNTEDKFITNPQTRLVTPNPNYKYRTAEAAFAELWGSALFDCGPEDYEIMVKKAIEAVRFMKAKELM
jgi:hypothetical protein